MGKKGFVTLAMFSMQVFIGNAVNLDEPASSLAICCSASEDSSQGQQSMGTSNAASADLHKHLMKREVTCI